MLAGIVVVVGLLFVILLASSQKFGSSGTIGLAMGALALPMIGSLITKGAFVYGWWMILVFVACSLAISPIMIAVRRSPGGPAGLVNMQPLLGIIGILASVGCWVIRQ